MVDTVRTEPDLLDNLFQDGQADHSITAQDIRDLIVSVKYLNNHGYQFVLDSAYTSGAPRAITGGTRTQITIDGLAENRKHPTTAPNFWNTVTNKIEPPALDAFGFIRLAFTAKSSSDPDNYIDLELDIGGGLYPVIYQDTSLFAKGATVDQSFNFVIPLFAGPDFVTNGGILYITPKSTATFWTFGLTAYRGYAARP